MKIIIQKKKSGMTRNQKKIELQNADLVQLRMLEMSNVESKSEQVAQSGQQEQCGAKRVEMFVVKWYS